MKRAHTNKRKALIKRYGRIYSVSTKATGFGHLDTGRRTTVLKITHERKGAKKTHSIMRGFRRAWRHLPSGYGVRPDCAQPFELSSANMAAYGTYKPIGLRLAYATSAGAKRISALTANEVYLITLYLSPQGYYMADGVYHPGTGRKVSGGVSATFDFAAHHPAFEDMGLIVISTPLL